MAYTITQATTDDIKPLAAFATAMFKDTFGHLYCHDDLEQHLSEAFSEPYFEQAIANHDTHIWLMRECDDTLIAYAKYGAMKLPVQQPIEPCIEIHRMYVHPSQKRKKCGTTLFKHCLDNIAPTSCSAIYLGVYSQNLIAQQFYARFGFEIIGEYDYYVGEHIDHELIMRKETI